MLEGVVSDATLARLKSSPEVCATVEALLNSLRGEYALPRTDVGIQLRAIVADLRNPDSAVSKLLSLQEKMMVGALATTLHTVLSTR